MQMTSGKRVWCCRPVLAIYCLILSSLIERKAGFFLLICIHSTCDFTKDGRKNRTNGAIQPFYCIANGSETSNCKVIAQSDTWPYGPRLLKEDISRSVRNLCCSLYNHAIKLRLVSRSSFDC